MDMLAFNYNNRDENDLKDWMLNYVLASEYVIPHSKTERTEPFLVVNREPNFWKEIPKIVNWIGVTTGTMYCEVAGPYCSDTKWLSEDSGHGCYVFQKYYGDKFDPDHQSSQEEVKKKSAVNINQYIENLKLGVSPEKTPGMPSGVADLSPRQFSGLISFLENIDAAYNVVNNNFERGPFIIKPDFDHLIEDCYEEDLMDHNKIAEKLVENLVDFIESENGLANEAGSDVYGFFFQK